MNELDDIRRFLINEPRGHADMYGCFVTPPDDPDGDLGVVFFHKDGFSTACGHGTIALVTWAIDDGIVTVQGEAPQVVVDAPSGRLTTMPRIVDGSAASVAFRNVPSFVTALGVGVETSIGVLSADVAFGGAHYACVSLDDRELSVEPRHLPALIALAREIKQNLSPTRAVQHATEPRLSGLYGVIFSESIRDGGVNPGLKSTLGVRSGPRFADLHHRNVTVFADGEVDRSPCGSGTSARMAMLAERGELVPGQTFRHDGIVGSTFFGRVEERRDEGWITVIEGSAHRTGTAVFTLDPSDPLGLGFQLR